MVQYLYGLLAMVVEVEITAPVMAIPIRSTQSLLAAQQKVVKNPGI